MGGGKREKKEWEGTKHTSGEDLVATLPNVPTHQIDKTTLACSSTGSTNNKGETVK